MTFDLYRRCSVNSQFTLPHTTQRDRQVESYGAVNVSWPLTGHLVHSVVSVCLSVCLSVCCFPSCLTCGQLAAGVEFCS